ncbi:autotransporter secretion outer membrane protein TamA [Halopseudomonas xinjiangensis]|uniref:Translocation and assembly module subunit TamA n=1 Tax=Halopseudomonas xinjiangensis TaxID=487184 RepID=A0A1H1QWT1_9GAMM|nr:autotransporter assembly complex family protein [Halopseudomonas xinjiangensis]SDS27934.1 autotransporter secretion outer membrane protein TamA [Halopseudomonas xinjiangensis]
MARPLLLISLLAWSAVCQAELVVDVEPANDKVRDNIRAFIGPVEAPDHRTMWRLARHSREQAIDAARALGYYDVTVRPEVTGPEDDPILSLSVQLGEPVRLREVTIAIGGEGQGTDPFRVPETGQLKPGAVLNHGNYESLKTLLSNQALRYGYFSGEFTRNRLVVNPDAQYADIQLRYDTGQRYRLGQVSFSETPFNEDLLDRMVLFEPGVPYNSDLLAELNRDLLASGYFDTVQVTAPAEEAEDLRIPVRVYLEEREPNSLGLGAGFSTDVGPRLRVDWRQHYLNAKGHSRGAELELSAPRQELTGFYQIPLTPPQSSNLRLFTGLLRDTVEDVDTVNFTIGGLHQRRLEDGWERGIGLRLLHERFTIGNDEGNSTLLLPSISFQKTHSDGSVDPAKGYSLRFELQGAKEGLVSDIDLIHASAAARGLYTVKERHRMLVRTQLGGMVTSDFDSVPPTLRFFAGGDQSVRGYDYRTLSPVDETGEHIGGQYLVAGSLEYQYEFIDNWRGAVFVDHGNAVDSLSDPLKTSVGVGIRWVSPVGPIRIDVAKSVSDPEEGFRIHFAMGPEL